MFLKPILTTPQKKNSKKKNSKKNPKRKHQRDIMQLFSADGKILLKNI